MLVANATLTIVAINVDTRDPNDLVRRTGRLVIKGRVVNDGSTFDSAGSPAYNNGQVSQTGGNVLDIELQPHAKLVNDGRIVTNPARQ